MNTYVYKSSKKWLATIFMILSGCCFFIDNNAGILVLSTLLVFFAYYFMFRDWLLAFGLIYIIWGFILCGWLISNESTTGLGVVLLFIQWAIATTIIFGDPIIIIPFMNLYFFKWSRLSAEQKKNGFMRVGALVLYIVVIFLGLSIYFNILGGE